MPLEPLAQVAFSTQLLSEIVEISNSVHKTCQELAIKFCLTTFNLAPTPLCYSYTAVADNEATLVASITIKHNQYSYTVQ